MALGKQDYTGKGEMEVSKTRFWVILMFILCLVFTSVCWGTEELGETSTTAAAKEEEEEEPPATFGPIITDTAVPIDKGALELQPFWSFTSVIDSFSPSWRRVNAGGNFYSFGFDLQVTYGLWENIEVFAVFPFVVNWAENVDEPGPGGERSAEFGGLSDINFTFKYRLVPEGRLVPTITGVMAVHFPTGHYRYLNPRNLGTDALGGGAYAFTLGFNLSKWVKPFIFYGNFYYTMQTDFTGDGEDAFGNPTQVHYHPRDVVTVNLAAEYPITKKWIALFEFFSSFEGGRLIGPKPNILPAAKLGILPGIEYMATEHLSMALGVGIDLAGKREDVTIFPIFSLVYGF